MSSQQADADRVIYATPTGTRDVLHDELREQRAITDTLRAVYEQHGYGEVRTPAIERDEVLRRGQASESGYRVIDGHGNVMALRPDMTVPIARLASSRFHQAEPPLRFSYQAHIYRAVRRHRGDARELLQSGVELLGSGPPGGTIEVLAVLAAALDAAGLRDYRIALGTAVLYPQLLAAHDVPAGLRSPLLDALAADDLVRLRELVDGAGLDQALLTIPQLRGGAGVLKRLPDGVGTGLRAVYEGLAGDVRDRIVFDLGLVRDLGYYTGAVFDILHPALGDPLGGGGRYDDLLARFGRPLPAVGFALEVERLHLALAAEEREQR